MSSTFEQDQISITQIASIEEQTDFIITRILEVNHIKTDYKLPFFIGKIGKTYKGAPKVLSIYYYSDRNKTLKNPYDRKELAIVEKRGRTLPQEGTWIFFSPVKGRFEHEWQILNLDRYISLDCNSAEDPILAEIADKVCYSKKWPAEQIDQLFKSVYSSEWQEYALRAHTVSQLKHEISTLSDEIISAKGQKAQVDEEIQELCKEKESNALEVALLQEEIRKAKFFACGSTQAKSGLSLISESSIRYDTFAERIDYTYGDSVVVPFLMALSTNQIITLYGPPGTGKTTLVSKMAKALGAKCTIVSVQNSWTDSADLLGYYSPIDRTYEGTTFVEALLDANREWFDKGKDSRLHLICLDEMNLARIEYYFATFLSLLQLPEDKRVVHLLPPYVEEALDDWALEAGKNTENTLEDEQKYLFRLRKYHSFRIPPNVHFIGTINNDDTTNELSPKVRDRSMFISLDSVEPSENRNLEIVDYYPISTFDVMATENIDLPEEFMRENKRFLGYAQTMVDWMMVHMPEYDPYVGENSLRTKSTIYNYLIITKILPVLRKTDDFNYSEYSVAQSVFAEHATSSEYFDLLGGN